MADPFAADPRTVQALTPDQLPVGVELRQCDRCRVWWTTWALPALAAGDDATVLRHHGCYRVDRPPWSRYGRSGETEICDQCLAQDAGYQRDYPNRPS